MSFTICKNDKIPFQALKRSSKVKQNRHFTKGVNPQFWSKNGHCSNFFFQEIQAKKMSFTIFSNEETTFQVIKTRSSKSRKIDMFSKGLTHRFGPKMAIFQFLFFQSIQARKMSFTIFYKEKTPFQAIKTRSLKSRNIDIF